LLKSVEQIDAALSDDNLAEAQKRVHSLKGEAASLAALRLHQAAVALEKCLRSEKDHAAIVRASLAVRTAAEQCQQCVPLILDAIAGFAPPAETP
jgi:HPt (histidine-containing phosphotransfer) domain-containing protein